ncbi:hypothetical protein SNOG_20073 [Parastagonospora nodorum SN15]|uniref:Uncharacterized protein n=1 Tax=Phaeosphaeria nodorum (strain SN15 / ATCC MYA-4574 / FGSC 10173) TaxID=321614 RepID=A9JX70_PHANO|nr:hypothetical protein SNOG_20073 [Parastagonospora nodorum SN15]EDP89762.1 hypothetical protein SNOG_20073 [Parastagonospora nodorum SN15]
MEDVKQQRNEQEANVFILESVEEGEYVGSTTCELDHFGEFATLIDETVALDDAEDGQTERNESYSSNGA